jgi:hypothetical protein
MFDSITNPNILKLVKLRHSQLGDEMFGSVIIIETGDSLSEIEEEIGFSILTNLFDDVHFPNPDFVPCFEALDAYSGSKLPPIPDECCHPFHFKAATNSG